MLGLRQREGIMASQAQVPTDAPPILEMVEGLRTANSTPFREPYED